MTTAAERLECLLSLISQEVEDDEFYYDCTRFLANRLTGKRPKTKRPTALVLAFSRRGEPKLQPVEILDLRKEG